jgi:hypothetical protein
MFYSCGTNRAYVQLGTPVGPLSLELRAQIGIILLFVRMSDRPLERYREVAPYQNVRRKPN